MSPSAFKSERDRQAAFKAFDDISDVGEMSDEDLALLPQHQRRRLIHRIALLNYPDVVMKRLLRSEPYPAKIAARDIALTQAFFKAWQASPLSNLKSSATPKETFLANCWLAAGTLDIDRDMTIRIKSTSLSQGKPKTTNEQTFEGAIAIEHVLRGGQSRVTLHLNSDTNIWPDPSRESGPAETAARALHELTHVEQQRRFQDKNGPAFYPDMNFQFKQVGRQAYRYDTYRNTLVERQAHYRQQIFMRLYHEAPMFTEQDCLKQDDINRFVELQPADFFAKLLREELLGQTAQDIFGDGDDDDVMFGKPCGLSHDL